MEHQFIKLHQSALFLQKKKEYTFMCIWCIAAMFSKI
jgi:hypothetical protein